MISAPGLSLSIQDKAVNKLLSPERDPQITTGLKRMRRIEALRNEQRRVPTAAHLKEDIDERTLAQQVLKSYNVLRRPNNNVVTIAAQINERQQSTQASLTLPMLGSAGHRLRSERLSALEDELVTHRPVVKRVFRNTQ